MHKPIRAILRRWTSLICCGALASAVWALIGGPIGSLLRPSSDHLASIRSDLLASAILIAGIAGCWPLGHRRWLAFFGLRHFWSYPPLWVAAATALLLIGVYTGITTTWQPVLDGGRAGWWLITAVPLWLWIATGVLATMSVVANRWPTRSASKNKTDGADLTALVNWLRDDCEISHPGDDRFDHDTVARRIVGRLTSSDDESPTMAIVGPLGSGKSTIRRLVAHHLTVHSSIQMLSLSLWPFDSAEAAVSGILRAVIRALGAHVNTIAVTGLSEHYVTTIERVAGRWGALARYLRGESQPEAILERLAAITAAAGVKLVLWIEDMERFTGADSLPPKQAVIREAERLGPILSLLYLLDRCDFISVIVGDTSLRSRLDVGKIARFVENPPRPTPQMVWRQIAILRSACLAEPFIDPANDERRKELTPPDDDVHLEMWLWHIRDTEPRIQEAVALLLNTPRAFKSALRLTWETWERLRGEIDFDSVLVASALRVARPDVFALIDEHISLFRQGLRDPARRRPGEQAEHPVLGQFNALLDKEESERRRNAVKAVIEFVFPAALRTFESDDDYFARPQGLSVNLHADYWRRYLTLPDLEARESDQAALRAIAGWKQGQQNDLISRLTDPKQAEQIETFSGQFCAAELCRLLTETVGATLPNESVETWVTGERAPGILSVWRMMRRRRPAVELLGDTLADAMRELVALHLPLAYDLYYVFAHDEQRAEPCFLDAAQRERVQAALREAIVRTYRTGTGEQLLLALRGGSPWVVYYLCRAAASRSADSELPFDGWKEVSAALLEAAEQNPSVGLAVTVPFFTTSELVTTNRPVEGTDVPQPVREHVAEADEVKARQLFAFERLAPLLARTAPSDGLDPAMVARFKAARALAVKFLEESAPSESANESDE